MFVSTADLQTKNIQEVFEQIKGVEDHFLAPFGYVPAVSIITGTVRCVHGLVSLVTAIALWIISIVFEHYTRPAPELHDVHNYEHDIALLGAHALTNIARGIIETIPLYGNLSSFLIDTLHTNQELKEKNHVLEEQISNHRDIPLFTQHSQFVFRKKRLIIANDEDQTYLHTLVQAAHTCDSQLLTPCGYIPIVSILSGSVRAASGTIALIGLVASWALCFIADQANLLDRAITHYNHWQNDLVQLMYKLAISIFRGIVEIIPIYGNLLTYLYDTQQTNQKLVKEKTEVNLYIQECENFIENQALEIEVLQKELEEARHTNDRKHSRY